MEPWKGDLHSLLSSSKGLLSGSMLVVGSGLCCSEPTFALSKKVGSSASEKNVLDLEGRDSNLHVSSGPCVSGTPKGHGSHIRAKKQGP